ncbi:MAG TPA: Rrf2 family transcriptional regulator [Acidimicrobiia bacterium]|nr:Rrf2 family transcriptional regulator [Acidimicrobiia bacterium]
MRLEVTRRADLAVRTVAMLAHGRRVKAPALAAALGTTAGFVPQVVGPLVKAGWIVSEPGPTGGYRLAIPVESLSVLDVVEAVDGPTDTGRCVVADRPCGRGKECALHDAWARARRELIASLGQMAVPDTEALAK